MTNNQNTKITYSQPSEQLFPERWPLSNPNLTKIIQVGFFKNNPIERPAAAAAANDDDDYDVRSMSHLL